MIYIYRLDKRLRQGNPIADILINLALEKVVRESEIQERVAIFYKLIQKLIRIK